MWVKLLSIPKLQRLHGISLGMDKWFHPTLCWGCDYSPMLGSKLNHVRYRAPDCQKLILKNVEIGQFLLFFMRSIRAFTWWHFIHRITQLKSPAIGLVGSGQIFQMIAQFDIWFVPVWWRHSVILYITKVHLCLWMQPNWCLWCCCYRLLLERHDIINTTHANASNDMS